MSSNTFKTISKNVQQVVGQQPPADQSGRLAHLVQVYAALRPFLTGLISTFFIPPAWRSAITVFVAALDAVTGDVSADFKAGKDL